MPATCSIPGCKVNAANGPKLHMFGFPSDEARRRQWIAAIPRKNFEPTKHSKVCELHFIKDHIICSISQTDSKTGQIISAPLTYPRLHKDATPSLFPSCPDYFSKKVVFRETREDKLKKL